MTEIPMDEMQADILASINNFALGRPVRNSTLAEVRDIARTYFRDRYARGEFSLIFDGAMVTGIKAKLGDTPDKLDLSYETDFFPRARYAGQSGDCIVLGFHGNYDLYYAAQGDLPGTLVARYGNSGADYESANPWLLSWEQVAESGAHFHEALRRAKTLGCI
ncbi:hypothetical protein [Pusillimonas noertemannii]|uniref:Uncharacterized protein n=1 Tax=Pusillimonas noertemannii TaxID=305977 RepID=A0A2U1CMD0_9BURK|nr:hypothetical protein [Pusillimonas noertemannii]NYT68829.1 hypothetical protein [Pusillimonas noertemannii]PVY62147.1 hypothetical protein C7440_1639 [Pusillimonas noertemannii]TFL10863.1 hypothetical protein CSC72_10150 [Pusillimonas noertemannii]